MDAGICAILLKREVTGKPFMWCLGSRDWQRDAKSIAPSTLLLAITPATSRPSNHGGQQEQSIVSHINPAKKMSKYVECVPIFMHDQPHVSEAACLVMRGNFSLGTLK
jgi:hypothetical protein